MQGQGSENNPHPLTLNFGIDGWEKDLLNFQTNLSFDVKGFHLSVS